MSAAPEAEPPLLQRRDGAVLHLTLNRPQVRNAMSLAMVAALQDALAAAEAGGEVRVVVLRGAGGHFCAGGDVKDMAGARSPEAVAALSRRFGELCVAYARSPLATVAVVEGTVMGGGFGLACVADVVIAGDNAVFRLPETSLGLVPAQIGPFLVERIGLAETRRLAVTGERLDAQAALALRLAHEVHSAGALEAVVQRVCAGILRNAPGAIAATKALLARARHEAPAALVGDAAAVFASAVLGDEGREGTAAFVAKRTAAWVPGA